jgi:type I restriction enzyme S subunit
MTLRIRHLAQVNPGTPVFDALPPTAELTFMPLETVWADDRIDTSRVAIKADVSSGYVRFQDGDVIVPKTAPTFQHARATVVEGLTNGVGAGSSELHLLRPRQGTDARFLAYVTRSSSFVAQGVTAYQGVAGLQRVPADFIADWPVTDFGHTGQQRIGDFLDDQVARLNRAISLRRRQTDVVLESASAQLTIFYTEAVEHFGTIRLGLLLNGLEQGWSPQCDDRPATAAEYGVLKAGAVNGGTFRPSEHKALPSNLSPRLEYLVSPGDLLMSRASGSLELIGSAAVVPSSAPGNLLLCDKIYRLGLDRHTDLMFIALMLRSRPVREAIKLGTSGAEGMANNLPSDTVRGLLIPAAPFAYQRAVAAEISSLDDRVRQAQEMLGRSVTLLEERKRALITAAVTGQFDVTTARAVA